jgi:hypothetical protein
MSGLETQARDAAARCAALPCSGSCFEWLLPLVAAPACFAAWTYP